jgi:branched-chain amino acid transport system substrate-binding protein
MDEAVQPAAKVRVGLLVAALLAMTILNARGILEVSAGSTAIGLTRSDSADHGSPGKYYATGARTFARVIQSDAIQAQALLLFMKQQGVTQAFVVHDGELYGRDLASALDKYNTRKGVEIEASERMGNPAALVNRIRALGADGVVYCGREAALAAGLFRSLHAADPRLRLFAPDALDGVSFTRRLGAAEGSTSVTAPGRRPDTYPASGREFFAAFQRRYRHPPEAHAIYAYEAMGAVLAAIARSKTASGGRANRGEVTRAFFATHNRKSPLGVYSIDDNATRRSRTTVGIGCRRGARLPTVAAAGAR